MKMAYHEIWFQNFPCLKVCGAQMFRCHRLRKNLGNDLPLGQDLVCDIVTEKHLQVDEEAYKLSNWCLYISSH